LDNIEIIIYIVISIGWFLLQIRKKRKLKKIPDPSPNLPSEEGIPSLEEQEELLEPERSLLKELLGESMGKPSHPDQPKPHVFSAEEEHESIEELAKEVKRKKKNKERKFTPLKMEDKTLEVESEETLSVRAWLFEDELGPQKAIILSEILNRREY
jgi:hypothetical protein